MLFLLGTVLVLLARQLLPTFSLLRTLFLLLKGWHSYDGSVPRMEKRYPLCVRLVEPHVPILQLCQRN